MTDHTNDAAAAVTDQAIAWLIRLRDPACTRQERKQFEAWLGADEAHSREYRSLQEIWAASGQLQPSFAVAEPPRAATRRVRFLRFNTLAALLSILLLVGLLAWHAGWLPTP